MKEFIGGCLLINNIIVVDNVVCMGICVPHWFGKEAKKKKKKKKNWYTFACIQKFINIV